MRKVSEARYLLRNSFRSSAVASEKSSRKRVHAIVGYICASDICVLAYMDGLYLLVLFSYIFIIAEI